MEKIGVVPGGTWDVCETLKIAGDALVWGGREKVRCNLFFLRHFSDVLSLILIAALHTDVPRRQQEARVNHGFGAFWLVMNRYQDVFLFGLYVFTLCHTGYPRSNASTIDVSHSVQRIRIGLSLPGYGLGSRGIRSVVWRQPIDVGGKSLSMGCQ